MLRKVLFILAIAALLAFAVIGPIGCSSQPSTNQGETPKQTPKETLKEAPKETPPDKVTFQLNWLPEDPIYWAAIDKGFWAEENLEVKIIKGQGTGDTITKIATKQAEFGIADVGPAILGRAKEDMKLIAVANYQTFFPAVVIYRSDRGINTPKDLEGKTIISSAKSAWKLFFPAFAKAAGIDESKIKWKLADSSVHEAAFVRGEVDAWLSDIEAVPAVEELMKEPVNYFVYRDYGNLDRYSQSILVHEDLLKENPDLVRRFVAGFLKGVKYALDNPAEVGIIVKKYVPEIDVDQTVTAWQVAAENNIYASDESREKGLGWMSRDRMAQTINIVLDAYGVEKEMAPEEFYTTEFLPKEGVYPLKK